LPIVVVEGDDRVIVQEYVFGGVPDTGMQLLDHPPNVGFVVSVVVRVTMVPAGKNPVQRGFVED
jgi:hypothetical protein